MIAEVLNAIAQSQDGSAPMVEAAIKERVKALHAALTIVSQNIANRNHQRTAAIGGTRLCEIGRAHV